MQYLFCSLGNDCYTTWTFRRSGIQINGSLPFDWMNTYTLEGLNDFLYSAISNNLHETFLEMQMEKNNQEPQILIHEKFNIRLPHEYGSGGVINFNEMIEKYKRRFIRLKEFSKSPNIQFF